MSMSLPTEVTIAKNLFEGWSFMDDFEKEEVLNDYLSDNYGFCMSNYFYEETPTEILITEIHWDIDD